MKYGVDIRSNEQLVAWLDQQGIPYQTLGMSYRNEPIVCVHKEGKGRPVLITAGSHASEPAGVSGALAVLASWNYDFPLYMVPLRDTFGCRGYAGCLSQTLGESVEFQDCDALNAVLRARADRILCDTPELMLVQIKDLLFMNMPYEEGGYGPPRGEQAINSFLQGHPQLIPQLAGKFVIGPANYPLASETVGRYERTFNAVITDAGKYANMNRQFGIDKVPADIRVLRELADKVQPCLTIDMHEGFGDSYYFFAPDYLNDPLLQKYVDAMIDAVAGDFPQGPYRMAGVFNAVQGIEQQFCEPRPGVLADLSIRSPQNGVGAMRGLPGLGFSHYCAKYGPAVTLESGGDTTMDIRIKMQVKCVQAALKTLEQMR